MKLLNQTYEEQGHPPIDLVLFAGDNGYRISWDATAIKAQGDIGDGAPEATVLGNHDGDKPTVDQLHAGKIAIINKLFEIAGIRIVGVGDPQETIFGDATYLRDGKPDTAANAIAEETDAGKKLYDMAREAGNMPIGVVHEGSAAQATLGFQARSRTEAQEILTKWFSDKNTTSAPIGDLPFSLLVYGHWHRIIEPKVVQNSDGTKTLVMELNTMGGAAGDNKLDNFHTQIGGLAQTASFPIVFQDKNTGLVTGYQMLTFETSGKVTISPMVNIDQPLSFQKDLSKQGSSEAPSVNAEQPVRTNSPVSRGQQRRVLADMQRRTQRHYGQPPNSV